MSFARSVLAVGLILATLSGSIAHAQEAVEFAAGEIEMDVLAYTEPVADALEFFEPVLEPTLVPVIEPTPIPTPVPTPTPMPTPKPVAVAAGPVAAVVIDNRFPSNELTVPVGATVTWTNNGFNFHTLTTQEGLFNSGPLGAGQTFSYTFQQAGNHVLICRQHVLNGMTGRLTVQ